MATENIDTQALQSEKKAGNSMGMVDLENKILQIATQKYYLDMRENDGHRFIRIVEVIPHSQRSRVLLPMVIADQAIKKLEEVIAFSLTYDKDSSKLQKDKQQGPFFFSVSFITPGGRRYYFDVLQDNEGNLKLKISYVYGERRDNVHIVVEALPDLVQILHSFHEKYPSLTDEEEGPRRSNGSRRNYSDRPRRDNQQRPRGQQNNGANQASGDNRRVNLKVLDDPRPVSLEVNAKKFTFEIVEGTNSFLRVTEIINGVRKSTLHVPVEACGKLLSIIGDFAKKLNSGNGDVELDGAQKTAVRA